MKPSRLRYVLMISGVFSCACLAQAQEASNDRNPFAVRFSKEDRAGANLLQGVRKTWTFSDDGAVIGIDFQNGTEKRLLSASDLPALASFPELRALILPTGQVTDEWVPSLAKLSQLEELSMVNAKVTNAGLKPLAKLQHLRKVRLFGARNLSDEAMETVADWEKLEELDLYHTRVSDDGVRIIRGLGKLRVLSLGERSGRDHGNGITNRSIDVLKSFTRLERLAIAGTSIDRTGVEALIEALPNCDIP